jgi:membrane protease YdiL (CAAX protease family)
MDNNKLSARELGKRIILALLFVAMGALIYIVFSPLRPLLDGRFDYIGRIVLISLLLVVTLIIRKSNTLQKYEQVSKGLLIMIIAVSLDWVFGVYLIENLGVNINTPAGFTLQKLNECVVVVSVVIAFTLMSGGSLGSIYIQKGKLKLGLMIGLITFFIAAAGSIPVAALFNARNLTLARIIPWIPWLLIFVLANALMEEILTRGLFLRKLEPFFGKFLSNLLIAFVFTTLHIGVTYPANQYLFLAILTPVALAWGYIMQKTDSIWGSVLFHAGMDIPIILGIFSNLS